LPFCTINGFHLELVNGEIFWLLLLKGFVLLARSFRISSLNFEPYLQSEINKSHINTTARFPTQFFSAAELSRAAKEGGGTGKCAGFAVKELHDLRFGRESVCFFG